MFKKNFLLATKGNTTNTISSNRNLLNKNPNKNYTSKNLNYLINYS